ncbi:cytochrome b N-terminal domain-containing protein [Saprospiraceae bacterium]|nr:cytochrome b N-terminal domain-containing protein [Saprospiraceae bacterium]
MKILNKMWAWVDDRTGLSDLVKPLMDHPVPRKAQWWYVFGSATMFCLVLQVVTGAALALMYQPSAETAFDSLKYISEEAVLGSWLRGLHYFGASGMILMMGIHMIRVYIMAAYKFPREMSWLTGVALLGLTIAMGFTGQLLRWDDTGVWSTVVAAEQMGRIPLVGTAVAQFLMGGETVGGHTLSRFFAYHVFFIPGLLFGIVALHVYLVVRNGISEPPVAGQPVDPKTYRKWYHDLLKKDGVPFFPDAAWRDVVFSVVLVAIISILAFFIGAPELTAPPDPTAINVNPKPDWYLSWLFALFALMPPEIENYVMFLGPIVVTFLLLALPFLSNSGERHPLRRPWAIAGVIFTVTMIGVLTMTGSKAPWSPNFDVQPLPASVTNSSDPQVLDGAQLFYKKGCLYCHKINEYGGLRGPDLTDVENRLTKSELVIRIVNGGKDMPAFGGSLSDKELNAIIAFLEVDKKQ